MLALCHQTSIYVPSILPCIEYIINMIVSIQVSEAYAVNENFVKFQKAIKPICNSFYLATVSKMYHPVFDYGNGYDNVLHECISDF